MTPTVGAARVFLPPCCTCEVFYGRAKPDLLRRITRLRVDAWSAVLPGLANRFPDGVWQEEADGNSHHWAILHDDHLVAASRLTLAERFDNLPDGWEWHCDSGSEPRGPVALLGRTAVAADWWRNGLSTFLFEGRLRWAQKLKAKSVVIRVAEPHSELILRRGFRRLGAAKPGSPIREMMFVGFALDLESQKETPCLSRS